MSPSRRTYDLIMHLWPLGKVINRLGSQPILRSVLEPYFSTQDNEAIILPVNEAVRGTESVVLPSALLTSLIERASARVVLNECLCRRGEGCRAYPHEPGCLFLGEGARGIDPHRGRPVGVEEALAHARQATGIGLVPLIVHAAFDAWLLDIPYRRMLAICFCCDCCCTVRHGLRLGPPAFWDTVVRLPGLNVTVSSTCTGCGLCLETCYVHAVAMENGRARIGERCKGCGRCAARCPEGAITLGLDGHEDVLARLLARIEARTDIGSTVR
jgi:UDP-glucose 4-epimerase